MTMRSIPIIQGEYRVVSDPGVILTTLLGSCIAVCLWDAGARVGGMNHFLLSEPRSKAVLSDLEMQRYGVHAMELLINEMMKKGGLRSRLRAQLYGGANITAGLGAIGTDNARFAREFLATEDIAVVHSDVGGRLARKIEFLPYEGKARSKHVRDVVPIAWQPTPALADGELELF